MSELVVSEIRDGVGWLRLSRASKRNALSHALVDQAIEAMDEFENAGVEVAVLTAEPPIFCAGNDLVEARANPDHAAADRFLRELLERPLLWIAAVAGPALGAGVAVAAVCPITLASDEAWFSLPELEIGLFPSGVLRYIETFIGPRLGLELGISGRRFEAAEARAYGLVNEVVPANELATAVSRWIRVTTARPPVTRAARESWRQLFRTEAVAERAAQLDRILAEQEFTPLLQREDAR